MQAEFSTGIHIFSDTCGCWLEMDLRRLQFEGELPLRMNAEARIIELKLELPPVPKAMGLYKPLVIVGTLAYVSGHAPLRTDGSRIVGNVGGDMGLDDAKIAARQSGLAILATLRNELGSLNRIKRVIKIFGMVNSSSHFQSHPAVIDGCSQLFVEVFGPENGAGVRSAAGMSSLPGNIAVEIEAIFEINSGERAL